MERAGAIRAAYTFDGAGFLCSRKGGRLELHQVENLDPAVQLMERARLALGNVEVYPGDGEKRQEPHVQLSTAPRSVHIGSASRRGRRGFGITRACSRMTLTVSPSIFCTLASPTFFSCFFCILASSVEDATLADRGRREVLRDQRGRHGGHPKILLILLVSMLLKDMHTLTSRRGVPPQQPPICSQVRVANVAVLTVGVELDPLVLEVVHHADDQLCFLFCDAPAACHSDNVSPRVESVAVTAEARVF